MNYYYFLPEDFAALQAQIQNIAKRIKAIGKEMGSSCQEGAETFHDNFAYEEGERQQFMWSKRLCELNHILRHARIYRPEKKSEFVRLGSVVTYADDETGEELTIRIGSYLNFADGQVVSYNSPIAKAMLTRRAGDLCEAVIRGRKKHLEILEVQ